jgi:uncharacterized membrane protein
MAVLGLIAQQNRAAGKTRRAGRLARDNGRMLAGAMASSHTPPDHTTLGNIAMIVWGLVLAVHILAMTAWVGGMAYALMVLRPSLSVLAPPDRLALHGATFARFFRIVWVAMPLVLLTGWAMVGGVYGGFAALPWPINLMQLLGLIMAVIFVMLFFGPWKRFRAQPSVEATAAIRRLIHANLGLGGIVIILAALGHWGAG